jgi:O-antigen/teichoic acid export membrane protein
MVRKLVREKLGKANRDVHFLELLKGSSISFVLKIFGMGAGYALTWYISEYYGAIVLGKYVLALIVLQVFSMFGKAGLDIALLRFIASFSAQEKWGMLRNAYQKSVALTLILSTLSVFVMYFFGGQLLTLLKDLNDAYLNWAMLFVIPMSIYFIHVQCFRAFKKIKQFSFYMNVALPLFTLLFLLYFTNYPVAIETELLPFVSYGLAILLTVSLLLISWTKTILSYRSAIYEEISYKLLLSTSLPLLLSQSMSLIIGWTDQIMLGTMATAQDVGVYNVAFKFSLLPTVVLMAINSIATPKFAEFFGKGDLEGLEKMTKQSTKMIFWFSVPASVLIILFRDYLLGFFPDEFASASLIMLVLIIGQLVNSVVGSVGYILQMTGHQLICQNILIVSAIMNVVLNLVLIPEFGILGAALASMSSMVFQNVTMMLYIRKRLGFYTMYLPFFNK